MKIAALLRRPRFALKTLLLVVTLICLWCGYYASQVHSRRQALARVAELGGAVWQQGQIELGVTPAEPGTFASRMTRGYHSLVHRIFGDVLRPQYITVDLSSAAATENDLKRLQPLTELQWLTVTGQEIDDAAARRLRAFEQLRWLDLSGTSVSLAGIEELGALESLKWLNVARTRVEEADLERIEALYPSARIGFPTDPDEAVALEGAPPSDPPTGDQRALWEALRAGPYSETALQAYVDAVGLAETLRFPAWYISAVYRANRAGMEPLLVIQVYNGTRNVSFRLGCLLVFGPDGELLREIREERVHWSLRGPTQWYGWREPQSARIQAEHAAAENQEVIDLLDLTGDGFDDIPTQRWGHDLGSSGLQGEATAIYSTASVDIPCLIELGFPNRPPSEVLLDLGMVAQQLGFRGADTRTLFLQTPCYAKTATGATVLFDLPKRTLATFHWDEEAQTYVGPTHGLQDTWIVLRQPPRAAEASPRPRVMLPMTPDTLTLPTPPTNPAP